MHELVQSPLAREDLKGIWRYTYRQWGADQAVNYLMELDDGMQSLIDNPEMGQPRDHIRQGYRSIQINRHVIYYRLQRDVIDIVRVLHECMDAVAHL